MDEHFDPIVASLDGALTSRVDMAINAPPDARPAAVAALEKEIGSVEAALSTNTIIPMIEKNGLVPIAILAPATSALKELRTALEARAQRK